MKTVKIKIGEISWYAHAPKGGHRWTYYGGYSQLSYKEHKKIIYVDPHTKKYPSEEYFTMDMINNSIALLKEPCHIELSISGYSFVYKAIKDNIYKYWKRNNWCYKDGIKVGKFWIRFDKLIIENGHTVEVLEDKLMNRSVKEILEYYLNNNE